MDCLCIFGFFLIYIQEKRKMTDIYLRTLNRGVIAVDFIGVNTIGDLKRRAAEEIGVNPNGFAIIYAGDRVPDETPLQQVIRSLETERAWFLPLRSVRTPTPTSKRI